MIKVPILYCFTRQSYGTKPHSCIKIYFSKRMSKRFEPNFFLNLMKELNQKETKCPSNKVVDKCFRLNFMIFFQGSYFKKRL